MKYTPKVIKNNTDAIKKILYEIRNKLIKKQAEYFSWRADAKLHHPMLIVFNDIEKQIETLDFVSAHDFCSVKKLIQLGETISKLPALRFLQFEQCIPYIAVRLHQYVAMDIGLERLATQQAVAETKNQANAEALNSLLLKLCTLGYNYFVEKESEKKINFNIFREQALAAIEAYQPEFKKKIEIKQIILNILLCVGTLLLGFLIAASIHKVRSNEFLFFKPKKPIQQQLNELKQVIAFSAKPLFIRLP